MSGIEAGIPLWDGLGPHHSGGGRDYFGVMHYRDVPHAEDRRDPTHRAYPVEYARRVEAVVAAARAYGKALDALTRIDPSSTRAAQEYIASRCLVQLGAAIATLDALAAAGSES